MNQNELILEIFKNVYDAIPIFQALADKERLLILFKLFYAGKNGLNVKTLSQNSWLSRPAISHHLKILKTTKIIDSHKKGTEVYYSFNPKDKLPCVKDIIDKLNLHESQLNLDEIETSHKDIDALIGKALDIIK